MSKLSNILICGQIRDQDTFRSDLAVYETLKGGGKINRIVFSGWVSELERSPEFIESMRAMGVEIILSPDYTFAVSGNYFNQATTLHFGLGQFSDSDVVIKTRTDKVPTGFDPEQIYRNVMETAPVGPNSCFSHRVNIVGALFLQPYFFNDMIYAGTAGDLRKFVSFDLWYVAESSTINVEQIFHSAPILKDKPYIKDFFRVNPGLRHDSLELADTCHRILLEDEFYLRCLWDSLTSLRDGYWLGMSPRPEWVAPEGIVHLTDLAHSSKNGLVKDIVYEFGANSTTCHSNPALEFVLDCPISENNLLSLTSMFSGKPKQTDRTYPLFSGDIARLAQKFEEAAPHINFWKPTEQSDYMVQYHRRPYVAAS